MPLRVVDARACDLTYCGGESTVSDEPSGPVLRISPGKTSSREAPMVTCPHLDCERMVHDHDWTRARQHRRHLFSAWVCTPSVSLWTIVDELQVSHLCTTSIMHARLGTALSWGIGQVARSDRKQEMLAAGALGPPQTEPVLPVITEKSCHRQCASRSRKRRASRDAL